MDYEIGNPNNIYLALFGLVAVVLAIWSAISRRISLRKFATARLQPMLGKNGPNQFLSASLLVLSIFFLAIALMDIRWGKTTREVPQKGIEVMFALDVSRSMLAEDVFPSRLARAKQQINDIVSEMAGDRIGLVVFAGEAKQKIPLTSHYDDFRQTLESVGPQSIPTGGSKLSAALQEAADAFINKTNDHKAIILFTDGEDQESQPVELAKKLHDENGIRVFTIGLGDIEQGSRIPIDDDKRGKFLVHNGEQVWSKLNGKILGAMATETDGAYIPAGTKRVNMANVYHSYVSNVEDTELETASIDAYITRFQWFAAASLVFLILEVWLTTRDSSSTAAGKSAPSNLRNAKSLNRPAVSTTKASAAAILAWLFFSQDAFAQDIADFATSMNRANQLVRDEKLAKAIDEYRQIETKNPNQKDQLNFNLGIAHYRNGDFESANARFNETAKSLDAQLAAKSRHNLGNGHYALGLDFIQNQRDSKKAIEAFYKSIEQYRSSLRLNRHNSDARANIELANALIKQLQQQQDQQQQDQQQQDQQQQDQQQQDQQQQDQQQQDQQQQDQQQQDQQQQDQQQQDQQQQDQQQQDQQQQDQQQQDQQQQDQQQQDQQQQDQQQQDQQQQDQQQQDQQQQDPKQAAPRDENKNDDGQPEGKLSSDNQNDQPPARELMDKQDVRKITKEEAMKMLQAVRDRDLLRRLRRERIERSRRVRVDRDW